MRSIGFLLVLIFFSCGKEPFYSEVAEAPDSWSYDEPVRFEVEVSDTSGVYEMQLQISHLTDYSFENIYFRVFTEFPESEDREELLNVDLASRAGQWMGRCNSGTCKVNVFLLDRFKFPDKGTYGFSFEQFTRKAELTGIESLQLSILKLDDEDN